MRIDAILSLLLIMMSISVFESKKKKKVNLDEEDELVEEEFKLISLNEKNYDQFVSGVSHFFVLFHNPWCKFSQNLEKKLMNVNKYLKMENQKYFMGAIDTTLVDAKKLVSEKVPQNILNSLLTYPKLVYYKSGKPVEVYRGKHNKNDIYTFMKRKINVESMPLPIISIFEDKIIRDKNAFVFFGVKDENFEIFNKVAQEKKEWVFYHTNEDKVYEKLNPSRNATVIYYTFGKKKDTFNKNQNFTLVNFNKFLKKNTFVNFYDKVTEEFINEVIMKKQSAMILFRNEYDNKTQFLEENLPLVSKGEPSLKFLVTDLTGRYELKLANLMNVGVQNLPALRILDFSTGMRRFEMSRELTIENLMNFIKMYKENKLHPYTISQGAKDDPKKKDALKALTSANFYESVVFNRKNVVVFFYSSWCTHCKKVF
jgi:hypothetical protein